MLSNILQQMKSPVLKYEHCYCLAQQCGINTHVELKDALQFLHENVGVVRYFHDIVNFQGFVIKDPQYVFDMITDLIVTTFTFHRTDPAVHEQFTKKGIFSLNVLMKMARSTEVLPPSKLVTLLQHLNIIAELKMDDGFTQYFMPCVLAHSKGSQSAITSTAPSPIPPLLVTFESGYCPKGLFGALVVYLLQNKMKSKLEWRLEQDEIFRDQICLSVGPYDTFQLKVFPAFLFIKHCVSSGASMRKISLPTVCSEVRQCINCAIGKVCEALHFYQKGAYSFGFFCPEAVGTDQFSHPAIVKFLGVDSVEPCNLTCLVTHKRFDLPGGYEYWFNEDDSTQARGVAESFNTILVEEDLLDVTNYLLPLEKIHIYNLGVALGLSQQKTKAMIESSTFLDDVIAAWLRREDQVKKMGEPSWTVLVKALEHDRVGQCGISHNIRKEKGLGLKFKKMLH